MAITPSKLFNPTSLPSTTGAVFTCPAATTIFYSGFTLHNTNSTAEMVELWNVPNNGGSVGTAADVPHRFLKISLAADETFIYEAPNNGIVHDAANDTIQGRATTVSKVNITPHGVKDV